MAAGYSVTFSVVDNATSQIEAINRRIRQMREPMERQAKAMQQFVDLSGLKKVADSFSAIGREAAACFSSMARLVPVMGAITGAASIAGLTNLVKGWEDLGQALTLNSTRIGTTSQNLELLQNATKLAGGSSEEMTASLRGLAEGLGHAQLGDPTAAAWFRRMNIAIRDTNGHLRTAADVLPQVIDAINALPNPMDRARAAAGLGANSLAALAEQFQRSGRTMPQWLAEAQKFAVLSEQQQQALQRYRRATGELDVAFTSLKEQIGATIGEAITPMIREFAEWVRTNQPQIIAAVRQLSAEFAAWIRGINWQAVRDGAAEVGQALVYLIDHLHQVKTAAEVIAALYAGKWALGMVASIGQVTAALGFAGAGGLAGVGLLGALGGVVFLTVEIIRHWDELKAAGQDLFGSLNSGIDRVKRNLQDWWEGKPGEGLPKPGETPGYPTQPPQPGPVPGYPAQPAAPGPVPGYPTQAPGETGGAWAQPPKPLSGADYRARAGELSSRLQRDFNLTQDQAAGLVGNLGYESGGNLDPAAHEKGQPADRGGIGWAQWTGPRRREFESWAAANNLDPKSSEANYGFLRHELSQPQWQPFLGRLRNTEGREQATDLVLRQYEAPANPAASETQRLRLAQAVPATPVPPAPQIAPQIAPPPQLAAVNENQIAPVAPVLVSPMLPTPQAPPLAAPQALGPQASLAAPNIPPLSGSVDVNITHQRPPPGVRLSATSTGDVNLNPPRTEQQQLSSVA